MLARKYLRRQGFKVLTMNYRTRGGEIDIIAREKDAVVFVEVKAADSEKFGDPSSWVPPRKQIRIIRTARHYLQHNQDLLDKPLRFDVVAVDKDKKINHIRDAFTVDGY